jgi:glycosyltransferase involved in cell wall biosynthesis
MSVSVVILTKNEQQDLPGCLASVAWSDDIHVFDSFSTDETVTLAKRFGARVTQREFDNWSAHQNWGLSNLPFKYPWVLYVDADERVTPELRDAAIKAVQTNSKEVAFRMQRRDFLNGTWLKHVQTSPYYIRLFRPEKIRYERLVNPVTIVDGAVGDLSGFLNHYPFSKGVSHWIARHNSYSTFEAQQILENRKAGPRFNAFSAFVEHDFNIRRFHQKELFYRLPMRPLIKFLVLFGMKRGFLDGRAGLQYALLQTIYEYFIVLKTRELERTDRSETPNALQG